MTIGNLREELAKVNHNLEELSYLLECSRKEISELNQSLEKSQANTEFFKNMSQ